MRAPVCLRFTVKWYGSGFGRVSSHWRACVMKRKTSPDDLINSVYDELRVVAESYLRRQPSDFTLCPTEIVHEACIHFIEHGNVNWTSAGHFRAIAICKMWQVIVDHLKRRDAQKRGGRARSQTVSESRSEGVGDGAVASPWKRIPLGDVTVEWHDRQVDLMDLAEALDELGGTSGRLRDVVTLHWFGGLTHAEVGEELGLSTSTAEKDYRHALAWLNRHLQGSRADGH